MNKDYLPSRGFIMKVVIIAIILLIIFGVYRLTTFVHDKISNKPPTKILVKDLVQKDTNSNGIPDWEESLWGLDPNKNGPSNKEFILAKREALAKDASIDTSNSSAGTQIVSENDALAREFFAVIMSLEQTGNLNDDSLKSVSEAIGKKIVAEPIADIYTRDMLTIKDPTPSATDAYLDAFKNLLLKYKDKNMGDELSFVATAVKNNDAGGVKAVGSIASAYRSFGKELVKIPVPSNLITTHLALANNYEKVAQSIEALAKIFTEPMTSMKGIVNYKKYNDALVAGIQDLSDNL